MKIVFKLAFVVLGLVLVYLLVENINLFKSKSASAEASASSSDTLNLGNSVPNSVEEWKKKVVELSKINL